MARMAVFLVDGGVHGLFPFGTTGEFYALDDDEYVKGLGNGAGRRRGQDHPQWQAHPAAGGCSHITTRRSSADQTGGAE